jgi:excisionase family DNA binding protein
MTERTAAPHPLAVVYTVDQFCTMMQHSRDTFERLVKRGELATLKVGRRRYVAKEEVERWLRETQNLNKVASPDAPPGVDRGLDRDPAARGGKRKRQLVDRIRHNA